MASSETGEQQMLLVYLAVLLLLGLGGVYVLFTRSKPPVASSEPKADVTEAAGGDRRRGGALDKMKRRQPMAGVARRLEPGAVALRSWLSLFSPLKCRRGGRSSCREGDRRRALTWAWDSENALRSRASCHDPSPRS